MVPSEKEVLQVISALEHLRIVAVRVKLVVFFSNRASPVSFIHSNFMVLPFSAFPYRLMIDSWPFQVASNAFLVSIVHRQALLTLQINPDLGLDL